MSTLWNSISAVLVILLMTATGYFSGRMGWMKTEHKAFINSIFVHVTLPCMCIQSILSQLSREMLGTLGVMLGASLCSIVLCMLVSGGLSRLLRLPRKRIGVFVVMAGLSNTVSIGLPMCIGLFGEISVPYVMVYYMANAIVLQSVGVALLDWSGQAEGVRVSPLAGLLHMLKKPPLIAIAVALLLLLLGAEPPKPLMEAMRYFGNMSSPLMLLYVGFILYEIGLKNLRIERGIPALLLMRFVVAPAVCLLAVHFAGIGGLMRGVLVAEGAMPAPSQVVNLAGAAGADEQYAAQGTVLTTLCCFVTIPLLMQLLSALA